jgi:hypothetical protein
MLKNSRVRRKVSFSVSSFLGQINDLKSELNILRIRLRWKPFELSYRIKSVFENMAKYKHGSDGVIFTSADAPYEFGTCDTM